ncbi:MAG: helix-turn-helix domain-containing protein [Bacteroidia bacterium]|nr:helix-turn-helix domain-containing protein [Bacteroidia bacterium]
MINSPDFAKRLEKIIQFYGLSASSFAEKIGVQRSSISHILSGRNKPSLEFVMKVLSSFPDVDLYWFLNGKGNFPKQEEKTIKELEFSKPINIKTSKRVSISKSIHRIVIFFSDGSFESYEA